MGEAGTITGHGPQSPGRGEEAKMGGKGSGRTAAYERRRAHLTPQQCAALADDTVGDA